MGLRITHRKRSKIFCYEFVQRLKTWIFLRDLKIQITEIGCEEDLV